MSTAIGIIAFVVALLVSVMLHEAGHFLFARRFGMKATEFFVGFGPKLWSRQRGETEYGVKGIPAGGYVKIVGMTPLEEVAEVDKPRAFYLQPWPKRLVVLVAGSAVHVVIAVLLVYFVLVGLGTPRYDPNLTVAQVSRCVPAAATDACAPGDPASPAAAAGLKAGDKVVSFNGAPVTSWEQLSAAIRDHGAGPVPLVVERDGARVTLTPDLVERERPTSSGATSTAQVGVLGVSPEQTASMVRSGPIEAVGTTGSYLWQGTVASLKGLASIPGAIPDLVRATFDGAERSATGLVGPVGIARVSGDVVSAHAPVSARVGDFLLIIASLNLFVGLFNMLPLLPMDGGHVAVLAFEQIRARVYRAFGRPDPGRVDLTKLLPAAYVVLVVLVGLGVLLLAADIVNPVHLPL
jgi:membrane-associated protease RseP (regulator of RpoE activity)